MNMIQGYPNVIQNYWASIGGWTGLGAGIQKWFLGLPALMTDYWVSLGGIKSKRIWAMASFGLWSFYIFLRERGYLRKKSLQGKHIFLTGAGLGLGREMAIKFAQMGANVSITDINESTLM